MSNDRTITKDYELEIYITEIIDIEGEEEKESKSYNVAIISDGEGATHEVNLYDSNLYPALCKGIKEVLANTEPYEEVEFPYRFDNPESVTEDFLEWFAENDYSVTLREFMRKIATRYYQVDELKEALVEIRKERLSQDLHIGKRLFAQLIKQYLNVDIDIKEM